MRAGRKTLPANSLTISSPAFWREVLSTARNQNEAVSGPTYWARSNISLPTNATTPDETTLTQAALVTGGQSQIAPRDAWASGEESIAYTQDLWPWVLLGMIGLVVLDLYAKRVRLFGYRTIKFT